jgi:hypothetical protein
LLTDLKNEANAIAYRHYKSEHGGFLNNKAIVLIDDEDEDFQTEHSEIYITKDYTSLLVRNMFNYYFYIDEITFENGVLTLKTNDYSTHPELVFKEGISKKSDWKMNLSHDFFFLTNRAFMHLNELQANSENPLGFVIEDRSGSIQIRSRHHKLSYTLFDHKIEVYIAPDRTVDH